MSHLVRSTARQVYATVVLWVLTIGPFAHKGAVSHITALPTIEENLMGAPPYRMTLKRASDSYTVSLSGEIDYAATLDLQDKLNTVTQHCENELRFDLGDVTLLDSEGLKLLVSALEQMHEKQGAAKVVRCSGSARRLITLSGVAALFDMD